VHLESCAGTDWLDPEQLVPVAHRCIALGNHAPLMEAAAHPALRFIDYCALPGPPEECLLRCVRVLHTPARSEAAAVSQSPFGAEAAAPAGSTVVLADDDTSVTSIVRRALERNGLTCQTAANGGEALSLISRVKPCAAVLDVDMPALDGFEVLSRIRSSPDLARTRVILLTGSDQESDIVRGFSLGAADYVCKPFSPMELTIRLMRVIGRL
jgi:CheY-like chemotaxis protein